MPNLFTHNILVRKLYNAHVTDTTFLESHFDELALGTQGPDPLFFEGIVPLRAIRPLLANKKLGNQIHRTDGSKFMACLIDEFEKYEGEHLLAYQAFVFGQFCHYILDKVCHPYVYYMSGFDNEGKLTGKYHYAHAHFEAELDVSMALINDMEKELHSPISILPYDKDKVARIEVGMTAATERFFAINLPKKYYDNALQNMRTVVKIANSSPSLVFKVLGKTRLYALNLPNEVDKSVLNLEKNEWLDPVSGQTHNESFVELFDKAYSIVEKAYKDVVKNGFTMETLLPYYDGLTYKGFLEGQILKYKKEVKTN